MVPIRPVPKYPVTPARVRLFFTGLAFTHYEFQYKWCVDTVFRLLGVFHDFLYGDSIQMAGVAPFYIHAKPVFAPERRRARTAQLPDCRRAGEMPATDSLCQDS